MLQNSIIKTVLIVFAALGFLSLVSLVLLGVPSVHDWFSDTLGFTAERNAVEQEAVNREATLNTEINNLTKTVNNRDQIIEERKTTITEKEQEIARLNNELKSIGGSSDDLREQINNLLDQIDQLQSDLNTSQFNVSKLQQDIQDLRDEINTKDKHIAVLQERLGNNPDPVDPNRDPGVTPNNPENPVIFYDAFDHGLAGNWSTLGNWTTSGGVLTANESRRGQYYSFIKDGLRWDNYAIDVDVKNINDGNMFSIVFRGLDPSNHARFSVVGGGFTYGPYYCFTVHRNGSSTCNSRQRIKSKLPSNAHLRIEVLGNQAIALLDGIPIARFSDSFSIQGMPGLYIYDVDGLVFDNFRVTLIESFSVPF